MRDPSKKCLHCAFYDDFDSQCKAHPPAYAGDRIDEYGDTVCHYSQPIIDYAWSETCGEWQAAQPNKTAEERMAELRLAIELDKRADPPA